MEQSSRSVIHTANKTNCNRCLDDDRKRKINYKPKHHNSVISVFGPENPFHSRCYQYKCLIRKIKGLLDEINSLNRNEVRGTCRFCKRINKEGNCRKCEHLAKSHYDGKSRKTVFDFKSILERSPKNELYFDEISGSDRTTDLRFDDIRAGNKLNTDNIMNSLNCSKQRKIIHLSDDDIQHRFKLWTYNVKQFLSLILEGEANHHKKSNDQDYFKVDELTKLLNELREPLHARELFIGRFPSIDSLNNITESKVKLEDALSKLNCKIQYSRPLLGTDSHTSSCPYFSGKKSDESHKTEVEYQRIKTIESQRVKTVESFQTINIDSNQLKVVESHQSQIRGEARQINKKALLQEKKGEIQPITETKSASMLPDETVMKDKSTKNNSKNKDSKKYYKNDELKTSNKSKDSKKITKDSTSTMHVESGSTAKSQQKTVSDKSNKDKSKAGNKSGRSQVDMFAKLLAASRKEKTATQTEKKKIVIPLIEELPAIEPKAVKKVVLDTSIVSVSESYIDCNIPNEQITEMVRGIKIIPIPFCEEATGPTETLLFKTKADIINEPLPCLNGVLTNNAGNEKQTNVKTTERPNERVTFHYMLSNKEFIDKGWTKLPTTKVMRRINIYKMIPAKSKFDWFEKHKDKGEVFYDTGEKLAEIQEDGRGLLFYKNGQLALDYYALRGVTSGHQHRYTVYSSGEIGKFGGKEPVTVLASFDYHGNGIVFDHFGNQRLIYNQSEGEVNDSKIGAPGRWKWHVLNDPPVLQSVLVDTHVKMNSCLQQSRKSIKEDEASLASSQQTKDRNFEMAAIELDNFLKEKALKILQDYKPFHIKSKALKLNNQFSLKVLDQSNIYILFQDGHTSIKFDVGMILVSNEIVDTESSELALVATPYNKHPPKSKSIADLQNMIQRAKQFSKLQNRRFQYNFSTCYNSQANDKKY